MNIWIRHLNYKGKSWNRNGNCMKRKELHSKWSVWKWTKFVVLQLLKQTLESKFLTESVWWFLILVLQKSGSKEEEKGSLLEVSSQICSFASIRQQELFLSRIPQNLSWRTFLSGLENMFLMLINILHCHKFYVSYLVFNKQFTTNSLVREQSLYWLPLSTC